MTFLIWHKTNVFHLPGHATNHIISKIACTGTTGQRERYCLPSNHSSFNFLEFLNFFNFPIDIPSNHSSFNFLEFLNFFNFPNNLNAFHQTLFF